MHKRIAGNEWKCKLFSTATEVILRRGAFPYFIANQFAKIIAHWKIFTCSWAILRAHSCVVFILLIISNIKQLINQLKTIFYYLYIPNESRSIITIDASISLLAMSEKWGYAIFFSEASNSITQFVIHVFCVYVCKLNKD